MPRPRREALRQATAAEIKAIARAQMREKGTAGLSLRGIAREMNITAPAIYNYFPRLDDLITALIVDAFNAHADAMEQAIEAEQTVAAQMQQALYAYRDWAVAHPVDFQLIYGNPIPGYSAPPEVTVPLARRPFELMMRLMLPAWMAGELQVMADYRELPAANLEQLSRILEGAADFALPAELLYLIIMGWTRIHGIVMLEIFAHLPPTVGDVAVFYAHEVEVVLHTLGLEP